MNPSIQKKDRYYSWLCERIDYKSHKVYADIIAYLHDVTFYGLIPNDDNRALDGIQLRYDYQHESGELLSIIFLEEDCSLLEMIIAIAARMAYISYDPENEDLNNAFCFWELIHNLGLKPPSSVYNLRIISNFLERRYEPNGKGGLFPLKNPNEDQRNVELWYQMMSYIREKGEF